MTGIHHHEKKRNTTYYTYEPHPCNLPAQSIYLSIFFFTFIYPLTVGGCWGDRWLHNKFPPFFSVLHRSLGLGKLQACPFPDVVFPSLFLPCLLLLFTLPCKMVLARPDERKTCPYHLSLQLYAMVRRSLCGPVACWILARTSSLVTWSLYEMRILR